jgi:hypothetical protein
MKKDNYNYKKELEKKALKKEAKARNLRRKQKSGYFDRID